MEHIEAGHTKRQRTGSGLAFCLSARAINQVIRESTPKLGWLAPVVMVLDEGLARRPLHSTAKFDTRGTEIRFAKNGVPTRRYGKEAKDKA
jgi:hypothetical protein